MLIAQVFTHEGSGYADVPMGTPNAMIYKTMDDLARALVGPRATAYRSH
jgi:hypothetical protein